VITCGPKETDVAAAAGVAAPTSAAAAIVVNATNLFQDSTVRNETPHFSGGRNRVSVI
jgi:hypothetical protein